MAVMNATSVASGSYPTPWTWSRGPRRLRLIFMPTKADTKRRATQHAEFEELVGRMIAAVRQEEEDDFYRAVLATITEINPKPVLPAAQPEWAQPSPWRPWKRTM